jgi:spore germination protein GerM
MTFRKRLFVAALVALLAAGISLVIFILTREGDSPACPTCGGVVTVQVFFLNNQKDPEITCTKVFPVARTIPKTEGVARAALEALFAGPTQEERAAGWNTAIPDGMSIRSLTVADGIARAELSEELERRVGGSCRVGAIRAEITETLKQFPTVREVVLSINGRTEDILQP